MRLTAMDISFKYTAGKINVEQTFHIEFDEGQRVNMTSWIIDKAIELEQAGFEPAVVKQHKEWGSPTARAHGGNGQHPDDAKLVITSNGEIELCPKCKRRLVWKDGAYKSGSRKGQTYHAKMHELKVDDCDFVDWGK